MSRGTTRRGNFSVEIARSPPWDGDRDAGRVEPDHTGREPVDVPDESGLEVALLRAHQLVVDLRDSESSGVETARTAGQMSLGRWSW